MEIYYWIIGISLLVMVVGVLYIKYVMIPVDKAMRDHKKKQEPLT